MTSQADDDSERRMRLGQLIEKQRELKGLTKKAAADLAGMSVTTLRLIEQGRGAGTATVSRLVAALGMDPAAVMSLADGDPVPAAAVGPMPDIPELTLLLDESRLRDVKVDLLLERQAEQTQRLDELAKLIRALTPEDPGEPQP